MSINSKNVVSILVAVVLSWSCREIIDIEIEQAEPKLVIEGRIVDQRSLQTISISQSINFYDTAQMTPYTEAMVSLLDASGNLIQEFSYKPADSLYESNAPVELTVGEEYKVQIRAKGDLLEATGKILENATLDSIYYLSAEELENMGQPTFGDGFFMFVDGKLNNAGVEYFKLDVKVNDTLLNSRGAFSNSVLTSEFFGQAFEQLPVPGSFEPQDSVELTLYTLNEDVYQYYQEFIELLFNDGGVFSPPPVNPTTNIKNVSSPEQEPLGFIQFSSVQSRSIFIEEDE